MSKGYKEITFEQLESHLDAAFKKIFPHYDPLAKDQETTDTCEPASDHDDTPARTHHNPTR